MTHEPLVKGQKTTPATVATIDHVVALRDGGTNDIKNLVAACHSCNQRRNNLEQKMKVGKKISPGLALPITRAADERPLLKLPKPIPVIRQQRSEVIESLADRIEGMMELGDAQSTAAADTDQVQKHDAKRHNRDNRNDYLDRLGHGDIGGHQIPYGTENTQNDDKPNQIH